MMDILTGKVNPSGKLAETYPMRYDDTPAFRYYPGQERNAEYREGIFVGYRYYSTSKSREMYPFGYGMSYTEFKYSDIQVDDQGVTFKLKNIGNFDGAEIVQMYISLPDSKIFRPQIELKGFQKVFLKTGEMKEVRIPFETWTFRFWNVKTGKWEEEGGTYQILIGASSEDIRLTGKKKIIGTARIFPYEESKMPSYFLGTIQHVEDKEFQKLLGHPIPDGCWSGELGLNDAICQMYYAKSGLARMIYRILTNIKKRSEAKGKPDLNILFIYNMPFRGIAKMTGGAVSMEMAEGMVTVVNGHFFKGMKKIIAGYFANARANKEYEKKLRGK